MLVMLVMIREVGKSLTNDKIVNLTQKFEHSFRESSNVGNVKKTFDFT